MKPPNDGIDSIRPKDIDSLDTSFKALLYDLYSRDLSRKTRSARRFRAQKGEYLGARPLYGYVKDPERKNHLIIDPPAAEIVRRIFAMVGGGMSIAETARALNQQQIPTPMQYKTATSTFVNWHCISKENFWTEAAILRIIRDEQYTGSTVYDCVICVLRNMKYCHFCSFQRIKRCSQPKRGGEHRFFVSYIPCLPAVHTH